MRTVIDFKYLCRTCTEKNITISLFHLFINKEVLFIFLYFTNTLYELFKLNKNVYHIFIKRGCLNIKIFHIFNVFRVR